MIIYKLTRKNTFAHFAPSHCITVSGQGSHCVKFLSRKASMTLECTHAVHCLTYFDINFVGERFKNKQKMKEFPSIQCESHVSELRVPLRAS